MIVVDAALFAEWLLNEPGHGPDDVWDSLATETVFVPGHWSNELANALRGAVASKRIRAEEIDGIVERVNVFDIGFAGPAPVNEIGTMVEEALQHGLSVSDMSYLRIARDHKLPLATTDEDMRRAATRLNIRLLPA